MDGAGLWALSPYFPARVLCYGYGHYPRYLPRRIVMLLHYLKNGWSTLRSACEDGELLRARDVFITGGYLLFAVLCAAPIIFVS